MTAFASADDFTQALARLAPADAAARDAAAQRQAILTKPAGSLGQLEDIALFMAAWQGRARPKLEQGRVAIFAGNHGFTIHGVSAFPPSVTAQMVANFGNGGAAINALSKSAGMDLMVVPLSLDEPTADFTQAPAMSVDECLEALNAGAAVVEEGLDLIALGEMGIGNSTAASALCVRSFAGNLSDWVGPGSGVDDQGIRRKRDVIEKAMSFHGSAEHSAFETLRRVGGREIAAMAGATLRARQVGVPVLLDGFICCSALAPLMVENPSITEHCLAGHCSAEPGHAALLKRLHLTPLLSLSMRLGEGSGAAVAAGVVRAALAAHNEMATFDEAKVSASL